MYLSYTILIPFFIDLDSNAVLGHIIIPKRKPSNVAPYLKMVKEALRNLVQPLTAKLSTILLSAPPPPSPSHLPRRF